MKNAHFGNFETEKGVIFLGNGFHSQEWPGTGIPAHSCILSRRFAKSNKVKDDSAKYSTKTQVGLLIHDPKRPISSIENIFILNLTLAYYNVCTRVKFNISIPIQFVLIEPCFMFNIFCQSLVRNKIYLWWGFRGVRPMKRRASIRKTEIRAQNMYKHTECPKKRYYQNSTGAPKS